MYEHYLLDNPQVSKSKDNTNGTYDPDYKEPEEKYYDPDFDAEWDSIDDSRLEDNEVDNQIPNPDIDNPNEWEEV